MKRTDNQDLYEAIFDIVRLVPSGRVTTYGAIAAVIGLRSGARFVGHALKHCSGLTPPVPAHRVLNSSGLLTGRHHFGPGNEMQELLEKEGIKVIDNKVVTLDKYFWDPLKEL